MDRPVTSYAIAALAVSAVAWITLAGLPLFGLASAALLFLLPVLLASARGGFGPGMLAALLGAVAYNFLLLPPRFTFRVHGFDNIVSVFVLFAVALVTSRLATRLKARELDALARARASAEAAEFASLLAEGETGSAATRGLAWFEAHYGAARLLSGRIEDRPDFSSLDLSAGAWAQHNGDMTGHGTDIMPAADWTFLPLAPRSRAGGSLLAIARAAGGATRDEPQLAQMQALALLLGQACDRAALERERRGREQIEESDRLRRAFLSSLAHDFRTPLTVLTGQLEALAGQSGEAREALSAARRLDRTIEDLLGAARLEEGALSPALESLDLVDAVAAALDAVPMPDGVAVDCAIPADLPFLRADPVLLHHVLINLLDNAARHAASQVALQARREGDKLLLSVADDGSGIPAAERERIFGQFVRLEGSDRREGSGLGLSIVKGFADAMGIAVEISDRPGGGACFTLAMDLANGEQG